MTSGDGMPHYRAQEAGGNGMSDGMDHRAPELNEREVYVRVIVEADDGEDALRHALDFAGVAWWIVPNPEDSDRGHRERIRRSLFEASKPQEQDRHMPACYRGGIR